MQADSANDDNNFFMENPSVKKVALRPFQVFRANQSVHYNPGKINLVVPDDIQEGQPAGSQEPYKGSRG